MSNYYKPSGKFSPISFVYFILVCTVALPILATIYAYLIWYIPIIYLNFLVTFGFGFAIAITVGYLVVRLGKVRSYFVCSHSITCCLLSAMGSMG